MADRTLELLLKTIADSKGIDEVKSKLGDLKNAANDTGKAGSDIGVLLGGGLAAATTALGAALRLTQQLAEQELELAKQVRDASYQLSEQEQHLIRAAENAQALSGAMRVGEEAISNMARAANDLRKAQDALQQGVGFWATTGEFLAKLGGAGAAATPFTDQLRQQVSQFKLLADAAQLGAVAIQAFAAEEARAYEAIKNAAPEAALAQILQRVIALRAQREDINPLTDAKSYMDVTAQIQRWTTLYDDVLGKQTRQRDLVKETEDETRLNNAAGNEELQIQERVNQAYDKKLKSLVDAKVPEAQAKQLASDYAESVRQAAEVRAGTATASENSITALLREQATILQNIQEQERLIREAPLMGIDDKQTALLSLYQRELQSITLQITATKAALTNSGLDPAQYAQLQQKLQQLGFEFDLLQLKIAGLKKPLSTELINWANSFGTTWQQVGRSIEDSVNTSLNSLNQLLLTGKFNAQELVQQLGNIALQLLEHIAIQQIMAALAKTNQATNLAMGPATAAAWAPAAAATSVGSFGSSAVVGEAAALAAIFAIMGALVAHEGGELGRRRVRRMHSGGLAPDEVPIIAQEGEFMVQRSVAQSPGMMEFLMALNSGSFHSGGGIRRLHRGGGEFFPSDIWGPDWRGGLTDPWTEPPNLGDPDFGDPSTVARGSDSGSPYSRESRFEFPDFFNPGYLPPSGLPGSWQGPTIIPTMFDAQGYPYAVPVMPTSNEEFIGSGLKTQHRGGPIGRFHLGGRIGGFPRMHSGGSLGGGSKMPQGSGAVNVAAFVDQRALGKWLSSRPGRKIAFDIFKGNSIDLGIR
jgi:hypothetical protein